MIWTFWSGVSAAATRHLSVAEAIAIARHRRSTAHQADIDVERAQLAELQALLERVRFNVQSALTEVYQRKYLVSPVDVCTAAPSACPNEAHTFTGSATLTVPIWTGFTVEADIARSHAQRRAAETARRATYDDIAIEVIDDYWTLRSAELRRNLLQAEIERAESIANLSKQRVEQGIAPAVEYNRSRVLVLRQQEQLLAIDNDLARAHAALALALQIDAEVELTDDPEAIADQLPSLGAAEREALSVRPEIAHAAAAADAQAATVQSIEGAYWPQISLFGQLSSRLQEFPPSPTSPRSVEGLVVDFVAGVQVQWVLFDTLSTWTAARDADYVRMRLEEERPRARALVLERVRTTHATLTRALERRPVASKAVELATQTLDHLIKRYRVGSALLVEILTAVTDLVSLESDLIDAQVAVAQANWELRVLLGRT